MNNMLIAKKVKKALKGEKESSVTLVKDYNDLIPAFYFSVSILKDGQSVEDVEAVGFSEVSGIGIEIQTEDIVEGGGNNYTIRLPKPPKFRNLVLKRAITPTSPKIVDWAKNAVENFEIEPRTVIVSVLGKDKKNEPLKTWNFEKAYPVKLSVSDLSATKNEVMIETLELAYMKFNQVL